MKLRSVDPRVVKVPEVRVTSQFDGETLAMFKASIANLGILEPPVVIENNGDLWVVDGLHRLVEAVNNRTSRIQVVVMEGDLKDVLIHNIALNNLRGKTVPTEIIACLQELYKKHGMSTDEIAQKTGFSRDYVERMLLIARALPQVLQALDEEKIGKGHALALSKIEDKEVQERVLYQQVMFRWPVKELEAHIGRVQDEVTQRVSAPAVAVSPEAHIFTCYFCGSGYADSHVSNPTTCSVCVGILLEAVQMARAQAAPVAAAN